MREKFLLILAIGFFIQPSNSAIKNGGSPAAMDILTLPAANQIQAAQSQKSILLP